MPVLFLASDYSSVVPAPQTTKTSIKTPEFHCVLGKLRKFFTNHSKELLIERLDKQLCSPLGEQLDEPTRIKGELRK
tara:strand:- start:354 stop:584 length:231 start_codon:yes stop_codon:yes gene_type:complete